MQKKQPVLFYGTNSATLINSVIDVTKTEPFNYLISASSFWMDRVARRMERENVVMKGALCRVLLKFKPCEFTVLVCRFVDAGDRFV